jgi:hypothetical protein
MDTYILLLMLFMYPPPHMHRTLLARWTKLDCLKADSDQMLRLLRAVPTSLPSCILEGVWEPGPEGPEGRGLGRGAGGGVAAGAAAAAAAARRQGGEVFIDKQRERETRQVALHTHTHSLSLSLSLTHTHTHTHIHTHTGGCDRGGGRRV